MTDFTRARLNMVNSQLATNGITHDALLEAYKHFPREAFVDPALGARVYLDEDLTLPNKKGAVLEPMTEARLLQEIAGEPLPSVLMIGGCSLPTAAMAATFASIVVVVERDRDLLAAAHKSLSEYHIGNVFLIEGNPLDGYPAQGPYNVILLPGAVSAIPQRIAAQLAPGGKILTVLRERANAPGRAVIVRCLADKTLNVIPIADASTPYLPGFEPAAEFAF